MADIHHSGYGDNRRVTIGSMTREDFALQKAYHREGAWDYDRMVEENGVVYTWFAFLGYYGLTMGQELPMTLHAGTGLVDTPAILMTSTASSGADYLMPEERFRALTGDENTVAGILSGSMRIATIPSRPACRKCSVKPLVWNCSAWMRRLPSPGLPAG